MSPFSDAMTASVIGTRAVREALHPRSELGRRALRDLPLYRAADADAWDLDLARREAVDAWWNETVAPAVEHALDELPTLDRPLRLLDADERLDEVALFEVKRFLFRGREVLAQTEPLPWLPSEWEARLSGLMQAIHPEREPTARFHLSARLDERLGPARKALKRSRSELRARRRDVEEAIVADLGGKFDVRGRWTAGEERPDDDARLVAVGAGRYELTDARVQELVERVDDESDRVAAIEDEVRAELTEQLRADADWLGEVRDALTWLDVAIAKVELRRQWNGTWGEWLDDGRTVLEMGRLPRFVETLDAGEIQPISVTLDATPTVVTGPNMGGKSALLELVGNCQWCAQHGLPIPADRFAFTPVETLIYVGAEERGGPPTGLSAFGREVRRVVEGRQTAAPRLWLLDEFGRGTHPEEGADIARRLVRALQRSGDRILFATHFPSVAALEDVRHLRINGLTGADALQGDAVDLEQIEAALRAAMDYRPQPSAPDADAVPRDARLVAEVLGLDLDD